jgi:xanthine dehydrogenase YagR molybdenum-binding subunit
LRSSRIAFAGQIVALVVAETAEIASAAADAMRVKYAADRPIAGFDDRGSHERKPKSMGDPELSAGDFKKAFRTAAAKIDACYETPAQHHNPLELFQTTCAWTGDRLTVWESSQNVRGYRYGLARQLGLNPKNVRVISHYVAELSAQRANLAKLPLWSHLLPNG